jgi:hypothetical protein
MVLTEIKVLRVRQVSKDYRAIPVQKDHPVQNPVQKDPKVQKVQPALKEIPGPQVPTVLQALTVLMELTVHPAQALLLMTTTSRSLSVVVALSGLCCRVGSTANLNNQLA